MGDGVVNSSLFSAAAMAAAGSHRNNVMPHEQAENASPSPSSW